MKKLEQNLMQLIHVVVKFQKKPVFSESCKKLTPAELKIFELVEPSKKIKMTEISNFLGITKGATSLIINKLVNKKLMTRSNDKNDRRIIYISLTKEGEKNFNNYLECKHKVLGSICKALKGFDPNTCNQIIEKLIEEFK